MGNIQLQVLCRGEAQVIKQGKLTPRSDPVEWKTITVGKSMDVKKLLERPGFEVSMHPIPKHTNLCGTLKLCDYSQPQKTLYFVATWFVGDAASQLNSAERKWDDITKLMERMHTTVFKSLKQPSIGITRLVFRSERGGAVKNLYVPSYILNQFEYFQKCEYEALSFILSV